MTSYDNLILNIKNFIAEHLRIDPEVIYMFNQNTAVVPKNKEYIIIQLAGKEIVSLPVRENELLSQLSALKFQIDCYGQNSAYEWSTTLYMLLNSAGSHKDLRKTGLSVITCDAPVNLTGIDFSDQYLERWAVNASLEITDEITIPTEYIDGSSIKIIGV